MKKNKAMRLASVLLVLVLLTSSVVGGTFAKYVTEVSSSDSARVAKWGFNTASINFEDLFAASYDKVAAGSDELAIIAPGTEGEVSFKFENALGEAGPEVAYTFKVDTDGSSCAADIQKNANIQWKLDNGEWGTWSDLIAAIEALDGDEEYGVGEIPEMVNVNHTVAWQWTFNNTDDGNDNDDYNDSDLGNTAVEELLAVTLVVTITATQVD